jgi:MerR family regulatory protein/Methyltransferase domain
MDFVRADGNAAGGTVGDLAQATGLSQRVLRHWEEVGLITPARTPAGHRRYGPAEITRLAAALGAWDALDRDHLDQPPVDDAELLMKVIETMTMFDRYVHGYRTAENARLHDQAGTLSELLHGDTGFPAGSAVLEVGCGVGAQTVTVAERSPGAILTAIDLSAESLAAARRRTADAGVRGVA